MKTCSLSDFRNIISPWLSSEYLQKVYKDDNGHFVLLFTDGVKDAYRIEDYSDDQLKEMFDDLKKNGVQIEE
ncbi:MAG: hypothetical protein GY777_02710 [Candidatus Brocadiaceae bacterium]|nr:hypothetical protein [Candidatus Brocadiaceae bacterium]